ncbi:MAG: hypothetical protein HY347_05960 [candidate division NC10 bacterium]|nr:hypothetical protein [candidate division NC10 bacterium]
MKKTLSIADPTIAQVLERFLDDQAKRLKPQTLSQYQSIIELLQHSLNGYAYQYLDKDESMLLDRLEKEQRLEFCQVFGPEKILPNIDEFLGYFMVRKVMAGKDLLRAAGTVTKKLARWLAEHGYAEAEEVEDAMERGAEAARDLPKAEDLAERLWRFVDDQEPTPVLEEIDDYFSITRVELGKIWLSPLTRKGEIGPFVVPRSISDRCVVGWNVSLRVGRTARGWRILEVGNVYPL